MKDSVDHVMQITRWQEWAASMAVISVLMNTHSSIHLEGMLA